MKRIISWTESDDLRTVQLLINGSYCPTLDIVEFSIDNQGYNEINDLIENLKQMRDNIVDICSPMESYSGQSNHMASVSRRDIEAYNNAGRSVKAPVRKQRKSRILA